MSETLVKCENVSKKFCRGLKRSLWYGIQDISAEFNPFGKGIASVNSSHPELRKDEFWAVNDISFELKRGECLGLIGHNGAGKSTLLKMLNGLIKPDHGKITMRGRIGAIIELNAGFNPILTGRENVYIYGTILGFTKKEIDQKYDAIVEFAELTDFMEMPFRSYSSGMKVRLGFAVAAQMEPDVLIIDEVLAVGDVGFRNKCYNAISKIMKNAAVIFVSHQMNHIDRLSTQGILLSKGKMVSYKQNMSELISEYYNYFNKKERRLSAQENCLLESITINDNVILPNHEISLRQMEAFCLKFFLSIPKQYGDYEIRVSFLNQGFEPVAGIHSEVQCRSVKNEIEKKIVFLEIPNLQLGTDMFFLSILVISISDGQVLIWDHAFAKISVYGDSYYPFPITFKGNWNIDGYLLKLS